MFIKKSVYDNILDPSYFNITVHDKYEQDELAQYYYNDKCVTLSYKGDTNDFKIKGKITIPTWVKVDGMIEDIPVVIVNGFNNCQNLTHCFFAQDQRGIYVR
jgi:hypothetical protein